MRSRGGGVKKATRIWPIVTYVLAKEHRDDALTREIGEYTYRTNDEFMVIPNFHSSRN